MKEVKRSPGAVAPTYAMEPADRYPADVSRGMTPEHLDAIMQQANAGDPRDQARLAREILERDWSISDALQTRTLAVTGCPWTIQPGDESPEAQAVADELRRQLETAGFVSEDADQFGEFSSFSEAIEALQATVFCGYSAIEVIWGAGGKLAGFYIVPPEKIFFVNSMKPLLDVDGHYSGVPLSPRKYLWHRVMTHGTDPTRGGLIRPLAWLYCFANLNITDMLSFVERHGMPFIVAKVDPNAWEKERTTLKRLVRNFGPSGGGVFTNNVELQLMESRSDGAVYFQLLKYLDDAVHKVVLGQTASSGDSSGLSGGDAQSRVREDIMQADCARIAAVINSQLIPHWMAFNAAPGVASPRFKFDCEAGEDTAALAQMVQTLFSAGLAADADEIGRRLGLKLTRIENAVQPAQNSFMPFDAEKPAAASQNAPERENAPNEGNDRGQGKTAPGGVFDALDALADESLSDDEFKRRYDAIISGGEAMDCAALAGQIAGRARDAFVAGVMREERRNK